MATTWTQADVAILEKAIASGTYKVRYADGRETTFRSQEQMLALLETMKAAINGPSASRVSYASFSRGT